MSDEPWWLRTGVRPVWVEITRRPMDEVGVDINHSKQESPQAYRLLGEVRRGDRVLHWHCDEGSFVGTSKISTDKPSESKEGGRNIRLHRCSDYVSFPSGELSLQALRLNGKRIGDIREKYVLGRSAVYYPFCRYRGDWAKLKPDQTYLAAAPPELVAVIGGIYEAFRRGSRALKSWKSIGLVRPTRVERLESPSEGFFEYRANEGITVAEFERMSTGQRAATEAAYRQHNVLLNDVITWLKGKSAAFPERPRGERYPPDLRWLLGGRYFVAEVKSMSRDNEVAQMRRAIGQVLQYRHQDLVLVPSRATQPVIVVPYRPDSQWLTIGERAGIVIVWPGAFERAK